ncbi:MAG TPA: T9SS type A sorting domain-containing protein [Flavobacterium sp.]
MKRRMILALFLAVCFVQLYGQNTSSKQLVRSTTGVSGSSKNINIQNVNYVVQQSVGQSSVIGTFVSGDLALRQGFIQPNSFSKTTSEEVSIPFLQAVVYPNPFFENIHLLFSEEITSKVSVEIFDITGRFIYSQNFEPSQNIDIVLGSLPRSSYVLKVEANGKQFMKKIIKK